MTNFLDPGQFSAPEVRAILQGMARVAHADGDDQRELILMEEFWQACHPDVRQVLSLDEVRREPFDVIAARAVLFSDAVKQTFLASCLLIAYSDGQVSTAEQAAVAELVRLLEIDPALVDATRERINALLLERLSRVSDLETLQSISAQL
jgi:uncharacterized membrane protein YebE (DUF533 family)